MSYLKEYQEGRISATEAFKEVDAKLAELEAQVQRLVTERDSAIDTLEKVVASGARLKPIIDVPARIEELEAQVKRLSGLLELAFPKSPGTFRMLANVTSQYWAVVALHIDQALADARGEEGAIPSLPKTPLER